MMTKSVLAVTLQKIQMEFNAAADNPTIPTHLSRQDSAYGDIAEALRKLIGDEEYEHWIETMEYYNER